MRSPRRSGHRAPRDSPATPRRPLRGPMPRWPCPTPWTPPRRAEPPGPRSRGTPPGGRNRTNNVLIRGGQRTAFGGRKTERATGRSADGGARSCSRGSCHSRRRRIDARPDQSASWPCGDCDPGTDSLRRRAPSSWPERAMSSRAPVSSPVGDAVSWTPLSPSASYVGSHSSGSRGLRPCRAELARCSMV